MSPLHPSLSLLALAGLLGVTPGAPRLVAKHTDASPAKVASPTPASPALLAALKAASGRFTPEVRAAAIADAKAAALAELAAAAITLPADFIAAIDASPETACAVYGGVHPAGALILLRSLEIDLGAAAVRGRLRPLALAAAACHAGDITPATLDRAGAEPDAAAKMGVSLRPRPPLRLVIPPCPLKPVNTHPTDRPTDLNDDIINFFEGRTIEVEERTGTKVENGKKTPVLEKRTRPLAACHVMASAALQAEFNAYMKARGHTVNIDCGDGVIHPDRRDGFDRKAPQSKRILEAFTLFKTAYEAKGLLPAARDPVATPAEWIAYLARNHDDHPAPGVKAAWPLFPLDAPWPLMLMLIQNRQPLREADDLWVRYRDRGEFRKYGEYIGGVAQQYDFQSARRLAPFPFAYGSVQMMFKDGGVCGTMANIAARGYVALGVPASTAGQPGHCALVYHEFDDKTRQYTLKGGQFVTGGPDKTTPHAPWIFSDDDKRRSMVYGIAIEHAVNHSLANFADSQLARRLALRLPEPERRAYAPALLRDAVALSPWNIAAVEALVAATDEPAALMALSTKILPARLAPAGNAGGAPTTLYLAAVANSVYARLATLPVPADRSVALGILADLETHRCTNKSAWLKYRRLTGGLDDIRRELAAEFATTIAKGRTPESCEYMAARLGALADAIPDRKARQAWATELHAVIAGHEDYVPPGARKNAKKQRDPAAELLCKYAGKTAEALALEAARAKELATAAGRDLSKNPAHAAP